MAMALAPATLQASPVPTLPSYLVWGDILPYPGDAFDWPIQGIAGYAWFADLSGLATLPVTVVDFTVTNITGNPLLVTTFQIFGNCSGATDAAYADFVLNIDGTSTPWTAVEDGPCLYHNYLDFLLPAGDTRFSVDLVTDRQTAPLVFADVRFGNVMTAVPLPYPAALLLGGLGALALVRRRRTV
jgi:hypothetical protein